MASSRLVSLAVALTCLVAISGCQPPMPSATTGTTNTVTVTLKGEDFALDVAADADSRTQGLMGVAEIPDDGGMIFIFPDAGVRSFWMGHCLTDIDVVFVDPRGIVTATHTMTQEGPIREGESDFAYRARLPGYGSRTPAQFAIELKAGTIDRLGITRDERLELDLDSLKAMAR